MQISSTYLIKKWNCYKTILMGFLSLISVSLLWHLHMAILEWKKYAILFFHLSFSLPIKITRSGGCTRKDQCCATWNWATLLWEPELQFQKAPTPPQNKR
jgi:hypothetical protein